MELASLAAKAAVLAAPAQRRLKMEGEVMAATAGQELSRQRLWTSSLQRCRGPGGKPTAGVGLRVCRP